ncbi:Retinoid-inducible serine carboxypeptidase [Trichoplax sp. H2]|nr:Retinoid-inducible serine carboxypeptidase [Trichoplax sp. H2]|eukprot:RDD47920.1 Retinoid-inducible serine carboxypeptidase [Trichoplax sp. H2]
MRWIIILGLLLCGVQWATASSSKIPKQKWGYVDVRKNAHMFWWFYGASQQRRDQAPLVMWLQGGPGGSSTGFGNFLEIGPLTVQLKPRNTTWLQKANLLFVDNPVGAGFSYVDKPSAYCTNVTQIANDLVTMFKAFLKTIPAFRKIPFYIFCESYGGKMTAAFGVALKKAVMSKEISVDFRGVALGDSWISPQDSVDTWGPYLLSTSLVDTEGAAQIQSYANNIRTALSNKKYAKATNLWSQMENVVENLTNNVNFYNILTQPSSNGLTCAAHDTACRILSEMNTLTLAQLMNGPIRKKLRIIPKNVTWGGQSGPVFQYQSVEFMKPVIDDVDKLLDMGVSVTVYTGQLDLIVDTLGTERWVNKLKWKYLSQYKKSKRVPIYASGSRETGAFYKSYKNLSFYWIMKAGHMVPADNGPVALEMLERVIGAKHMN